MCETLTLLSGSVREEQTQTQRAFLLLDTLSISPELPVGGKNNLGLEGPIRSQVL